MLGWIFAITCVLGSVARADEITPPEAARAEGAVEPFWLTYAAFRNDVFSELIPPMDDWGFTHDNVFTLRRRAGALTIGGGFLHRWITSREDRRRWDLLSLFATAEHAWAFERDFPLALAIAGRAGPAFGGNYGGQYFQNGWHAISGTGPTVEQGLANDYPGDRTFGFTLGARARAAVGERVQAYSFYDGQLSLGGTGVTSMQAAVGGSAASKYLGAHVEVALSRYHVSDPNLALPGAYRTGFQLEWRVGVDVHFTRFRVGYEYRANESGSGEPVGVFEFSSQR